MGRRPPEPKPLPPIWRTPDELWVEVERILAEYDPPSRCGPAWIDRRPVLDALIRDERPPRPKHHPARRWVVERTIAWLHQCHGILIRWEKEAASYLGRPKLACALLWFRRWHRLTT
jgi:hypothetical protein